MISARYPALRAVMSLRREEAAVVVAAMLSFGVVILLSNGIPYGLDGNETFSSIVHAINFLNFDFSHARGLADETLSRDIAAHSFVHTHQGNFPRVFATLLYAIGFTSPEGQVIATALLIGVPSVLLWYLFLVRLLGKTGALFSIGFLLTDYALFLQTQLVTYRAWHFFFIAVGFYCVQRLIETSRARWNVALFFLFICLFYYELLFATFLAVAISIWAIWNLQHRPFEAMRTVGACFAGAVLGFGLVVVQVAWLLGWDGMVRDFLGTVLARNSAKDLVEQTAELKAWSDSNRIVFFMNLIDGGMYRNLDWAVRAFTTHGFLVYSPFLFVLIAQWGIGRASTAVSAAQWLAVPERRPVIWTAVALFLWALPGPISIAMCSAGLVVWCSLGVRGASKARFGWLAIGQRTAPLWILWYVVLLGDDRLLGAYPTWSGIPLRIAMLATILGLATAFAMSYVLGPMGLRSYAAGRINVLLLSFIALAGIVGVHSDPTSSAFWIQAFGGPVLGIFGTKVLIACNTILVMGLAVKAPAQRAPANSQNDSAPEFLMLAVAVLCAILAVDILLPGYLFSGYLVRYCVFLAPLFGAFAGYGIAWFVQASQEMAGAHVGHLRYRLGTAGVVMSACAIAAWAVAQVTTLKLIPPGEFAHLIKALRSFPGASLAVNTYAAPMYVATGANAYAGWAYADAKLGRAGTRRTEAGFEYIQDFTFLWFADGVTNEKYLKPALYVCLQHRVLGQLMAESLSGAAPQSCKNNKMIAAAIAGEKDVFPAPKLLAADRTGGRQWAVVEIDYDFPPFLTAAPAARVAVRKETIEVDVKYEFRQQHGAAESESTVEVRALGRDGACDSARLLLKTRAAGGSARLVIPRRDLFGQEFLIVGVQPATKTRLGPMMYSQPVRADGQPLGEGGPSCKTGMEVEFK